MAKTKHTYITEETSGGGNCAFNAFILAFCQPSVFEQLEQYLKSELKEKLQAADDEITEEKLNQELNKKFSTFIFQASGPLGLNPNSKPRPSWKDVKKAMLELRKTDKQKLQDKLHLVMRNIAMQGADQESEFQRTAGLIPSAFNSYVKKRIREEINAVDKQTHSTHSNAADVDDIFITHQHIENQFKKFSQEYITQYNQGVEGIDAENLSSEQQKKQKDKLDDRLWAEAEDKLKTWWKHTGYASFIENMQNTGTWAGDIELARLAAYFNVNLCEVSREKNYHIHIQCGEMPVTSASLLTDEQTWQLAYFGIIDSAALQKENNEASAPLKFLPLSEQEIKAKIQDIPEQEYKTIKTWITSKATNGKLSRETDVPVAWSNECKSRLLQRGIIRLTENGNYKFNEFRVDGEEISARLKPVVGSNGIFNLWKRYYKNPPMLYLENKQGIHWQNATVGNPVKSQPQQPAPQPQPAPIAAYPDIILKPVTSALADQLISLNDYLTLALNRINNKNNQAAVNKAFLKEMHDAIKNLALCKKSHHELHAPLQQLKQELKRVFATLQTNNSVATAQDIAALKIALENAKKVSKKCTRTAVEFASSERTTLAFEAKARILSHNAETKKGEASTTDQQLKAILKETHELLGQAEITESMLLKTIEGNKQSYFAYFKDNDELNKNITHIRKSREILQTTIALLTAPSDKKLHYYGDSLAAGNFERISAGTQEEVTRKAQEMLQLRRRPTPANNSDSVAVISQQANDAKKVSPFEENQNMQVYASTYHTRKQKPDGRYETSTTSIVTAEGKLNGKYQTQIYGDRNAIEKDMPNAEIMRLAKDRVESLRTIMPDQKAKLAISRETPTKLALAIINYCELNKEKGYIVPSWQPLVESHAFESDAALLAIQNEMKAAAISFIANETKAYTPAENETAHQAIEKVTEKNYSSFFLEKVNKILGLDEEQTTTNAIRMGN